MNSAVKQLQSSVGRAVGRWTTLFGAVLALPVMGQGLPFNQGGTITVNDATFVLGHHVPGKATPYPSSLISSNGLKGVVQKITVTLPNITHASASDIDVLLVRTNDNMGVVLMSDVGLGGSFSGATVTIDPDASSALPQNGNVGNGTFKPTDFDLGGDPTPDNWPDISPAPTLTDLASLYNADPNAGWRLYVVDDQFGSSGSIAGWTLNLFTTPVFTKIPASVTNNEDTQFSVPIEIDDSDTPIDQLKLSATASDTNIIGNESFAVNGTGKTRTLTFTPKPNANGVVTVTVRLEDDIAKGDKAITSTFDVHIDPINDRPTIELNTNAVATLQAVLTTNVLYAVVNDVDNDRNTLTLSATSSDNNVVDEASGVFFVRGTAGTNSFAIAPRANATGTATVTVRVTDGSLTNSAAIVVNVTKIPQAVFGNSTNIVIPDSGKATAYPSTVTVSGVGGRIGKVTATLADLSHGSPVDLDVLLVGPQGQKVILMGAAGGTSGASHRRIVFDDDAAAAIPAGSLGGDPLTTATYRPADHRDPRARLDSPAPDLPYSTSLSAFAGTDPNGVWSVYVMDRSAGDSGEIAGGFILTLYPAPVITGIPDTVTTNEDENKTINFTVSDYDGSVTNITFPAVSGVATGDPTLTGTNVTLVIKPASNFFGTRDVSVVAKDDSGFTTTRTFSLVVNSVNDAPTIDTIARQTTYAGVPIQGITFMVNDVANETPPGQLTVSAQSDNAKLIPSNNIILGSDPGDPTGATRTMSLFPVGNQAGTATITVTVTDNGDPVKSTSKNFVFEVLEPASPLYLNGNTIVIQDSGDGNGVTNAQPYPSTITVSNLVGKIEKVRVTLLGLQHPNPDDIDILLVGPDAAHSQIVLMSDAGGANSINNVQLLINDDAAASLPDNGTLTSGVFKPSDYAPADSFPNAPTGPSGGTLDGIFGGKDPNGTWSLYVVDDTGNTKGATLAGWMINFETTPVITNPGDQTTDEDTEKRVAIDIGDNQPGLATEVTATSSNPSVVANSGLVVTGLGEHQTLTITPVGNASGIANITLHATVNGVAAQDVTFKLTVNAVQDAPTIANIDDQSGPAGLILGPVQITVTDNDAGQDPGAINVTATSSDENVLPNGNIKIEKVAGDATKRTLVFLPNGNQSGSATVTVSAQDTSNPPQKSSKAFKVTFNRNLSFANTEGIQINDATFNSAGLASPYPSSINVSGIQGLVSKVSLTLRGVTHGFPQDIAILLVKGDKKVVLLSNAGGTDANAISGLTFGFSDSGQTLADANEKLNFRRYKPAMFSGISTPTGNFPSPAPGGAYSTALSAFNNIDPNGDWQLYVIDDTQGESGSIANGWVLVIETAPSIAAIGNQKTPEDTPLQVPITISDQDTQPGDLITTAIASAQSTENLVVSTNLLISPTNTLQRTLTITPTLNLSGTNLITVSVSDGSVTTSRTFGLEVTPVDDPPIVGVATNLVIIPEDTVTNIVFTVRDIDSVLSVTNASASSDHPNLVPNTATNLVVSGPVSVTEGTKAEMTLTVTPAANAFGTTTLGFSLTDGKTTTTHGVTLQITPVNDRPTISGLVATTNVVAGGTLSNIPFTVGDVETGARELQVTATSSDQTKIPNANLSVGGADANRFLTLTSIGAGTGHVIVTVTVSDGDLTRQSQLDVEITGSPANGFANTTAVTIRDNNTAQPDYPSIISVSDLLGPISKVAVSLEGFSHTAPDDVDILLVSPTGKKIVLLSDAGGGITVTNTRLVFDSVSTATIPDNGPLVAGTYKPTNYGSDDTFSGVSAPYDNTFADLVGDSPNGDWKLYILDDTAGQSGTIAQGWTLSIVTSPSITISPTFVEQNEDDHAQATLTVRDADTPDTPESDLSLDFASSDSALVPKANVKATKTGGTVETGITYTLDILPGTNQPLSSVRSTNVLTVTVTRNGDKAHSSAVITNVVNPINDAPIISRITHKESVENRPVTFTFAVNDIDTPPDKLSIVATSGNQTLINNTNLVFVGNTNSLAALPSNELQLTLVPNAGQTGDADITLTVTDHSALAPARTAQTTFQFTVTSFNDPPTITDIPNISIPAGQSSTNIAFTIADQEGGNASGNLILSATSSDQTLVKNANIVFNTPEGPPGARTVRVTSEVGITGTATITVKVSDGVNETPETFSVDVVESRERAFANNRAFIITDNGPASVYPSTITVDGLVGAISQVTVSVNGLAHTFPQDVDMLLVGPTGKSVLILSDVGGGSAVTNINLTLSDTAANGVPTPIASGTYKPSNSDTTTDAFASPAPSAPYATALSEFNGTSPSGEWKLFVMDDTASDFGFINGGWSLNITTQPIIRGLADQTIDEDATFRESFTLVEEGFVPVAFTFRTTSTNAAVIRPEDMTFDGSGTNWVLTGHPVANASGTSEITVFAKNGFGQEVSSKFKLTVNAVNDAPSITQIPNQNILAGTRTGPIEFNYTDSETPQRNLVLSIDSSNTRLVPTNNVVVVGSFVTITPVGNLNGRADITLTVTDEQGLSSHTTFSVIVAASPNPQFANSDAIVINDNSKADPYPSTIDVSGVRTNLTRVTVTLAEITHNFPGDIDVLLVGPQGQKVLLMSDAGGSGSLANARITFADNAANQIPSNPTAPVESGTYKPTNYDDNSDTFPSPAPGGPYSADLSAFNGSNPNGTWSLYVRDDTSPDAGRIAGGWLLSLFTTEPTITQVQNQVTDENKALVVNFHVDDADTPVTNLLTSATTDKPDLFPSLIISGQGNDRTLTITPRQDASGQGTVTLTVSDGTSTAQTIFTVTVQPVNQGPRITGIASQLSSAANNVLNVPFQVSDRETSASNLVVAASIANGSLAAVAVSGSGGNRTLTITPSGTEGQTTVQVTASDGSLTTTNTSTLTIGATYTLSVSSIPDQTVSANQTRTVSFTVTGPNGVPPVNPVVTAVASGTNLVDHVSVAGSGTNFTATIVLKPNASGTDSITVTAMDNFGTGSTTFGLTVGAVFPPVLQPIPDQESTANIPLTVPLNVSDPDTPVASLLYTWTTSNGGLVRNVAFGLSNGTNVVATILPVKDATGSANITIFVDDSVTKVQQTFRFTVVGVTNLPPVFGSIPDQTTTANSPVVIPLNVSDPDTPLQNLVFTSSTSNPSLVSGVTVDISSGSALATVTLVPNATGLATVIINVSDGATLVSQPFALSVQQGGNIVLESPTVSQVGGVTTITITWTGGGVLESAPSVLGPWTSTGNSSGSFSEPTAGGMKYYRVRGQ